MHKRCEQSQGGSGGLGGLLSGFKLGGLLGGLGGGHGGMSPECAQFKKHCGNKPQYGTTTL